VRRSGFATLAAVTAGVTYLLIVVGGVVRVSGSGLGCGTSNDWPLCQGGLLPPLQINAIIEFSHRWIASVDTLLVVVLTVVAWLTQRQVRRLVVAATLAGVFFLLQIALGALTVKYRLPGGVVMVHLANALLLLGVLTYIAVTARRLRDERPAPAAPAARRAAVAAAATYLLALSGALVVETGASAGCAGWPLCGGGLQLPAGQADVINVVHRVVAGVVVLVIAVVMIGLLRRAELAAGVRRWAGAVLAIAALQVAAGALVVELRLPAAAQAVHVALASALWASTVVVAVLARPLPLPAPLAHAEAGSRIERRPAGAAT
jgi:heme A synthase